jgi:diguanylate cyclase (GGDEF)-like protein
MMTMNDVKRNIYLIVNPIIMAVCLLIFFLYPDWDLFHRIALPVIIVCIAGASFLVYKRSQLKIVDWVYLAVFSLFHIGSSIQMIQQIHKHEAGYYICWSPLFYVLTFMVLPKRISIYYAGTVCLLIWGVGFPHFLHANGSEQGALFQYLISQLVYILILVLSQKVVGGYMETELLRKLAFKDSLTETVNRRGMEAILEEELERHQSTSEPLSLIFFDIDHFKKINDTCGHETGDLVLKEVTSIVKKMLPLSCTLGRWGGEEFLILAKGHSLLQTKMLSEEIRTSIERHTFKEGMQVTASFGISSLIEEDDPRRLVWRADVALYEAKIKGRNQTRVHHM